MDCKILRQVSLKEFSATGKTKHYFGKMEFPKPSYLQIVTFKDQTGYYLFYLNENMEEMTDTFHETLERALKQAEWEFGVQAKDWEVVNAK